MKNNAKWDVQECNRCALKHALTQTKHPSLNN